MVSPDGREWKVGITRVRSSIPTDGRGYPPAVIGKLFALGGKEPYRHPAVWLREPTDERERLRIGAGMGTIALLEALAGVLREPLFLLVVMRVPRVAEEAGRWESVALTKAELARFAARYGELFEDDARAQLWVGEIDGVGMLVLDEHDLIYAYGPLHRFEQVLRERGYTTGDPRVPEPHEHHYNHQFDALEGELRRDWAWNRILPLDAVPED